MRESHHRSRPLVRLESRAPAHTHRPPRRQGSWCAPQCSTMRRRFIPCTSPPSADVAGDTTPLTRSRPGSVSVTRHSTPQPSPWGPTPTGPQTSDGRIAGFAALCRDELLALYVRPGSATGSRDRLATSDRGCGGTRRREAAATLCIGQRRRLLCRHRYRAVTPLDLVVNGVAMPGMLMEKRLAPYSRHFT